MLVAALQAIGRLPCCRRSRDISPVDATGRRRGVAGVWVVDAPILPSRPEANPQLSLLALALAVAGEVIDQAAQRS